VAAGKRTAKAQRGSKEPSRVRLHAGGVRCVDILTLPTHASLRCFDVEIAHAIVSSLSLSLSLSTLSLSLSLLKRRTTILRGRFYLSVGFFKGRLVAQDHLAIWLTKSRTHSPF
jgi:hypothetical protein